MPATFLVDAKNTLAFDYSYFGTIVTDTTTTGSAVDCQLGDGMTHLHYIVGAYGDLVTQAVIKLQESADGSTSWTDITDATVTLAASATANDETAGFISTKLRSKRYVRVAIVTSGGGTVSVQVAASVGFRKKIAGTGNGAQL